MRIKEAASATGLTERAIRVYEDAGLVSPKTVDKNGRDFRDYGDGDIERLRTVAVLRRARFSIEEIKTMVYDPDSTASILYVKRQRIADDAESVRSLSARLHGIMDAPMMARTASELAKTLSGARRDRLPTFDEAAANNGVIYEKYFTDGSWFDKRERVRGLAWRAMCFIGRAALCVMLSILILYLLSVIFGG